MTRLQRSNHPSARPSADEPTTSRIILYSAIAAVALALSGGCVDDPLGFDDRPIDSLEQVTIGGVDQWILIRGEDRSKPVLLVLHGGPGTPLTPWVDMFQPSELEENFVVVHWDQRGAGKSFDDDLPPSAMMIDDYVEDTLELANRLRVRFLEDKIYLTGISWGSALGFMTVMRDSEPFHALIAAGERVHWRRSQQMSFDWVKYQAVQAGNGEILTALASIEPFEPDNFDHLVLKNQGLTYFGGGDFHTPGLFDEYLEYALTGQSPYYTDADVENYMAGRERSLAAVLPQAFGYDLFRDFPVSPIPVHFLVGEFDNETPSELSHEYFHSLRAPAKTFTVIPGAGHDLIRERPSAWANALISIARDTR